ncbi:MAG: TlpA disulfide reductase family protein [candidate division WOR-3 bacterium]
MLVADEKHLDFALEVLDSSSIRLAALRGQPVVLCFWQPSSPVCRLALPELKSLMRKYQEDGVRFLVVSLMDSRDSVAAWARADEVPGPIALGTDSAAQTWHVKQLPPFEVLDARGRSVFREEWYAPDSGLVRLGRVIERLAQPR